MLSEKLLNDLRQHNTSLGEHPAFPMDNDGLYTERIIGKRFKMVEDRVKYHFDTDEINERYLKNISKGLVFDVMEAEKPHRKKLGSLGVDMVKNVFNIGDDIEFVVEITDTFTLRDKPKRKTPEILNEYEFDDHGTIERLNNEIKKRRMVNSLIHGFGNHSNYLYKDNESDIVGLNPRLPQKYGRMLSVNDYLHHKDDGSQTIDSGQVKVSLPGKENAKPIIRAQALTLPALINELTKGILGMIAYKSLPEDKKERKYIVSKADYTDADRWDNILGASLWCELHDIIGKENKHLTHHIYHELINLPYDSFVGTLKEVLANTKAGKAKINNIVEEVKKDLLFDEFNDKLNERRVQHNDFKNKV